MTPETIALKLTDAQREAILEPRCGSQGWGLEGCMCAINYRPLQELGVAQFEFGEKASGVLLTPLGIQVRDYLEKGCG